MSTDSRRIKFLARDLPFPTDPTYREYRVVEEITGVTAQDIMTGAAGIWMLPSLAIVALLRSDSSVPRESLDRVLDLVPQDITITGSPADKKDPQEADEATKKKSTGTKSTEETLDPSGTLDSDTSSQELPESQTT
jgi:hypothetical protein